MTSLLLTVDDIADQVRQQLDESNRDSIDTETDILPALNRAQDYAFDIYARKYPEPILAHEPLTLVDGTAEYNIPESVFEDRILKVEIAVPGGSGRNSYREVQRISFRDITEYESSGTTAAPVYYCIVGRKLRFLATPNGTYAARIWYLRNPEKLVLQQGRVNRVVSASNYVVLDSVGDDLTTESDQLASYVNVVDGQTGEVKGSLQIQVLADNRVTFRASPLRSSVLNRTIDVSVTAAEVAADDYLCAIDGTCVAYYGRPTSNFLIQYAVAELTRKLGGASDMEERVLDRFEKQVERSFVNREQQYRVKKRSSIFGRAVRRWFPNE